MQTIEQNSTATWAFYVTPTKDFFLLVATQKCSCRNVFFNAVNQSAAGCSPTFDITEVGDGGVEDLDTGKVRLNPGGSWTISLYEQDVQFNKDPLNADLLITEELKVISDGCTVSPPSGVICPPFTDVIITDAGNPASPVSAGSGEIYTCAPISGFNCQLLNSGLTQAQRQVIQGVNPTVTGVTASAHPGDDGYYEAGRLVDWLTLNCNNPEGNTNRFTVPVANYILDYATRLAWNRVILGKLDWEDSLDFAEALIAHGFNDWRIPNPKELESIFYYAASPINYAPFLFSGADYTNLWTSTEAWHSATNAFYRTKLNVQTHIIKTNLNINFIVCRNF